MHLEILDRRPLPGIPSASGIEATPEGLYVMGDDAPWLYRLDDRWQTAEKIRVHDADPSVGSLRIPKPVKPDFEALAAHPTPAGAEFFLFGSGSLSPQRDALVIVGPGPQRGIERHSLTVFYDQIKTVGRLPAGALNIEAALLHAGQLYLFNRGDNLVAACPLDSLLAHLRHGQPCPLPAIARMELPAWDGAPAGFSGATLLPGTSTAMFTASVEHTDNWIDDGPVGGSYVGLLDLPPVHGETPACLPVRLNGDQPLQVKVESVAVAGNPAPGVYSLLLVTDGDDGGSELLEAVFYIHKK